MRHSRFAATRAHSKRDARGPAGASRGQNSGTAAAHAAYSSGNLPARKAASSRITDG